MMENITIDASWFTVINRKYNEYKCLLDEHAEAVKLYEKATNGYKTGHERAVRNAMTALLKAENNG